MKAREAPPRRPRISIAFFISSPVYASMRLSLCGARVSLFVWRACVVLFCVARVCCALLSAASARPAGKPPAKRLGKHRVLCPSGGGILEKKYLNFDVFFYIKQHRYFDQNHNKK